MQLPAWASPNHPVARREFNMWRRILRRWSWIGVLFALLPFACTGLFTLVTLPLASAVGTSVTTLAILAGWSFLSMLWITSGLMTWALGTFANIGASIMVARERETHNWAMLRLTAMPVREIISAKIAALARLIFWPTAVAVAVAVIALAVTGLALMGVVVLIRGAATAEEFPPGMEIGIIALIVGGVPLLAVYTVAATLISLLYNCAVGLLTSTLTRTTASAVILSFVVHFGLLMFVMVPVQQVVAVAIQILSTVMSQTSMALYMVAPVVSAVQQVVLQAAIGAAAFAFALNQAQRIVE
jgi:hypothetical protein